jgi:hypothetical protein
MFRFKAARLLIAAFAIAIAVPTAMTIAARVASASGYLVGAGITGEIYCNPGGNDDCPD